MGDWLIVGILVPTVSQLSGGSSMAVAGILIAKLLPSLLLSSFTGAMVDRFSRRDIMMAADVARFVLVLFLLISNSLALIYLVLFIMETCSLFYWPARNALIPNLVEETDIPVANSFMYTTQRIAMILGLATSGAIMRAFEQFVRFLMNLGIPNVTTVLHELAPYLLQSRAGYVVNSLTFIISFVLVLAMRRRSERKMPDNPEKLSLKNIGSDALDSFRFLGQHIELRGLLISIFIAIVGGGAIVPVGLSYIASLKGTIPLSSSIAWLEALSSSRQIFLLTFAGIGMAAGAAIVPRLEKRYNAKLLFPASIAIFAIGMLGFALNEQYFIACLYATAAGFCVATLTVTGNNYVIQHVDDELRGRVFSATESVLRVSLLFSMLITAPLSDLISGIVRRIFSAMGVDAIFNLALTGPRMTLIVAASIVAFAAAYSFKTLYFGTNTWKDKGEGVQT